MENVNDKFVFRKEWADSIKGLNDSVRLEVLDAIIDYSIKGRTEKLSSTASAVFNSIKMQIDRQRDISEKRRKAVNARWAKAKKNASGHVSLPAPCSLSDSTRNEPVDTSKSILGHVSDMEQRLDSLSRVVAWQQEEEKRARAFEVSLYHDEEAEQVNAPTNEEQVYEYMHTYTMGVWYIDARDEARQFMDYYVAKGWTMGQAPMRDWQAAARSWINMRINKIKNGNNRQKQADYENDKAYYRALRSIEEDARYKREHGEPELHY